jgi:HlyD family secretion protein
VIEQTVKAETEIVRGRRNRKRWLMLGIAGMVVILGLTLFAFWPQITGKKGASDGQRNTITVTRGSVDMRISATGVIRPFNQVKVSPKFTGLLKRLLVQQGDSVKQGQLLALMDDSNLLGQVQAAQSAYFASKSNYEKMVHGNRPQEVAEKAAQERRALSSVRHAERAVTSTKAQVQAVTAQLERDETNARRLTLLAAQGAVSDQDRLNAVTQGHVTKAQLDQARASLQQAEAALTTSLAELDSAREQHSMMRAGFRSEDIKTAHDNMIQAEGTLKYLQSQLNDTRIRAPFAGIVSQKYTDEGAIVTPTTASASNSATSSSILSLAGRLELVASVSETDINHIAPGQAVEIVANAYPDKVFHGTVTRIAPEAIITQNVTTFEVHATIDDDKNHMLLSGMNVNSDFLAGKKDDALVIPTACIISKQGKTGVLLPDKEGNPQFKPIKIGTTSGTKTVVERGLHEGDKVFLRLTKAQLEEQGYQEPDKGGPGSGTGGRGGGGGGGRSPGIPRGFGR